MKSKTLGAVLTIGLLLTACGGESGGDAATAEAAPAAQPAAQPAPAATPAGGQEVQLPEGVTMAMVENGKTLFNGSGTCHACHAQGGTGTPLAPNLTDAEWLNVPDGSYAGIVELIKTGVATPKQFPGVMLARAGMPLSDSDVNDLAAYVYTLAPRGGM